MEGQSIGNVLRKIERHIGPERAIFDKTADIKNLTSTFLSLQDGGRNIVKTALCDFQQTEERQRESAKEALEVSLASYLFSQNRKLFEARNGADSMMFYDNAKELRQMEAVVRALEGQHGQIGTGEGKTSVILPITTIIRSLTSTEGGRVIFSSDSQLRVNEFSKFARPFTELLQRDDIATITLQEEEHEIDPLKNKREDLKKQMERGTMVEGCSSYSSEVTEGLKTEYWQSKFDTDVKIRNKENQSKETKPIIEMLTHDQLMERYMNDEVGFAKEQVPIYMDEAHAPFDRGTPTQLTSEIPIFSPEQARSAAAEWALHYVIGHTLNRNDIDYSAGKGTLTEPGADNMAQITICGITRAGSPSNILYKQAIKEMGATYGLVGAESLDELEAKVTHSIHKLFSPIGKVELDRFNMYSIAVGEKIAQVYFMNRDGFITTPEGNIVIRDEYQDELLLSHQYDRETDLAVHGLNGTFKVILEKKTAGAKKPPSLFRAMAKRVTCFSGTLMDDEQKTPFARFLEDETKKKVFSLENPFKKTIPTPEVSDDTEKATTALIEAIGQDTRGSLIIDSTTIKHSKDTYEKCVAKYGADQVRYIGSKPTGDFAQEQTYEAEVKKVTDELAEGKIKVLISTGSIGVGMNIIKATGEYPNIKVAILGIPKSKLQLKQILGRRRAADSVSEQDYFWYLGEDQVEEYISFYQEEERGFMDKFARAKGTKKLVKDMMAELVTARGNPVLMKKFILDIMKNKELMRAADAQYDIEYDTLYAEAQSYCEGYVAEKIIQTKLGKHTFAELTEKDKQKVRQLAYLIGTPASLYQNLYQPLQRRILSADDRSKKPIDLIRQLIVKDRFLQEEMDAWMEENLEPTYSYYSNTIEPMMNKIYKEGFKPGVFAYRHPTPPQSMQYTHVIAPNVFVPRGYYSFMRLMPEESSPPAEGSLHSLCMGRMGGTLCDLFPLRGGTHQLGFRFGERIEITQFPVPMENGVQIFLYHEPLPNTTPSLN